MMILADALQFNSMLSFVAALALVHQSPELLDKVRHALEVQGGKPWSQTSLTGTADYYGIPGKYSLQFTKDGRFIQSIKNDLGDTIGYDGTTVWQADYSGAPHETRFESGEGQLALSMLLSDRWLDPDAPVTITAEGNNQLRMKLKNSDFEALVNIDVATSTPTGATFTASSGIVMLNFANWKPVGDHRIPFEVKVTSGGLTDTLTVVTAKEQPDSGRAAYSMPNWKPKDITFDHSKPVIVESKKAFTGHILVHPLVNGQDVGWFILDSGAEVMVIDPAVADSLKLQKLGRQQLVGIGGSMTSYFRKSASFTLGQATLKGVKYSEFDLSQFGKIMGVKVAGVLGFDFMRRTVIGLDLVKPLVTVEEPSRYHLPSGTWTPVWFDSSNPVVQATFEGERKAFFRFDTGANGTVTFHAPYTAQEHLLDNRTTTLAMMGGVGGMITGRMGTLKYFDLGGHHFENPKVVFSQAKQGAFTSKFLAGNIGQDFMTPFTIVMDFGSARIGFVPKLVSANR